MAKANSIIGATIVGDVVTFTVKGAGSFTFDPTKVSAACRARAEVHGFTQRISDGAAMSRDQKTGQSATPEAKLARMKAIADHYMSGTEDWQLVRAAGKPRAFDVGQVVVALIRAGVAVDVDAANHLIEGIAAKRSVDRTASAKIWAASDKVAKALAEMAAEAAPEGADDLLAELEGEGEGEGE